MALKGSDNNLKIVSNHSIGATVQVVVDVLFARIKSEEYPTDSRLPSERSLSTDLAVARNTVREALDVLENSGVIQRRAGSGSFVTYKSDLVQDVSSDNIAQEISPLDHLSVRGIIEPEMVRLAVINMSPRDIEQLGKTLSKIENITTDANAFFKHEEDLFRQLAKGTRNLLLESCYALTLGATRRSFRTTVLKRHLSPKRIQDYQQRYNSLFNAISSRDVESAVEFIKLILVEEQQLLLQDF
jgi:GntR family transcriptional repressor for pyruvate dehydrogenase complex